MPTENELKYLLKLDCEDETKALDGHTRQIRQGYLAFSKGMSLRIRETCGDSVYSRSNFELTFKQKVNNRVVEIEKRINVRDFEDLWSIAINRLEKIRYDVYGDTNSEGDHWEIDAFKDHDHKTYIVVAEHEMPEGQKEPTVIPEIIKKNLLYAVPLDDDRFASKKLADVKYAKKLYQSFKAV